MTLDPDNPLGPLVEGTTPTLDAVTRDRLEAGLRVQHASLQPNRGPRRAAVPRWLVVGPLVAVLLIAATVGLLLRDEAAVAALELRDAENVTVTLSDGVVVVDPDDGFALTDGAIVVVGDDGRVTIDDVTLSAGAVVTVRDGRLVTDVVATTTTDRPAPRDDDPEVVVTPPDEVRTTTTTTVVPSSSRPPTDQPPDDRPDDPGRTSLPPEPRDTTPPSDDPAPEKDIAGTDIAVALRIDARDGGILVAWNAEGLAGTDWRVVVVRTTDGSNPADPASGTVVAEGERGEILERRADLPDGFDALRYRVIVLDEGDGVVARSVVQTFTPPGS